ncbi:hypothetical protein CPAR01_08225 [Colletotrichum paranaense]|uniref:Uncharacterized protein n=1 Tax=Colletotrichum paranaense TaxID=1914294 RepID=A0ABQ9SJP5_9PEZI|nr:uncharacterized protein CPAR01_08225 [Colletotrichum paranaense]KAK1538112.1 hypothetical protein CPAR01_08225 [Colletotrichum paranaense]
MFGAVVGSTGWMEGGTKDIWDGTPPPGEAHASFAVADGEALDEESHGVCQSVVSTLQAVAPALTLRSDCAVRLGSTLPSLGQSRSRSNGKPGKRNNVPWSLCHCARCRSRVIGQDRFDSSRASRSWRGMEGNASRQSRWESASIVAWHHEDVRTGDLEVREGEVFRVEYVQSPRYVLSLLWYILCKEGTAAPQGTSKSGAPSHPASLSQA